MCGIVGLVMHENVNQHLFDALTVLQHRGQDAAGMATCQGDTLAIRKSNGYVRDAIRTRHMLRLQGTMGIGHVRYPTAGELSGREAQPFYVNAPYGIVLAHNGNLTNASELRQHLENDALRHINTRSDSEILLNIFAHYLQEHKSGKNLQPKDIFAAVAAVHRQCRGAYAVVAMILGYGIIAFRDPNGIRPLIYGQREAEQGTEYMVASESVALDMADFTPVEDVAPGEAIIITEAGEVIKQQCAEKPALKPCIFEYVYLARPDSMIDKISVYKARLRMGEKLGQQIKREWQDHDIDVVIPIPDTSRTAAHPLARQLGVKYREGFVKNRYIPRTFIMPGQTMRRKSVRQKLNAIELEFSGKNVLLVDDSIVRGTTSYEIIQMAREAGANKVYFASASPPIKHANVYGIDMPSVTELIAHDAELAEIEKKIDADRLFYLSLDALVEAASEGNPDITRFEDSVFTGDYITGDIDAEYLNELDLARNDSAKQAQMQDALGEDSWDVTANLCASQLSDEDKA